MNKKIGLYLILTDPIAGYEACARAAVECGVRLLQLRMKDASLDSQLAVAGVLREITRGTATQLIINDNLDVAMEVDADGVHLGQTDQPLPAARARWNKPGKIFSLSTHCMEQMQDAITQNADYIGVGPVFPTPTKQNHDPALGIEETARIVKAFPRLAVAIGGIQAENLPQLLAAGIENWCVVRAVNQSMDPAAAIQHLQGIKPS